MKGTSLNRIEAAASAAAVSPLELVLPMTPLACAVAAATEGFANAEAFIAAVMRAETVKYIGHDFGGKYVHAFGAFGGGYATIPMPSAGNPHDSSVATLLASATALAE
jgi:hypothetical protein